MPGVLCEHCTAICCRYIALPIDKPRTPADFDDVRWFLMHENVSVFIEDGDWYILFQTPCRYLRSDRRCGIYQTRPRVCRKYSTKDCDYHSGDYGWEEHFICPQDLEAYERATRRRTATGRRHRSGPARRRPPGPLAARNGQQCDRRGVPLPALPREPRARSALRRCSPEH